MHDFHREGVAIVIETGELAQILCELLREFGYEAIAAPTHAAAAERALELDRVALLAACVPAPDESRSGVYLEEAISRNQRLAIVLMLNDRWELSPDAPAHAVRIVKPFGRDELIASIRRAEAEVFDH